jgi:hypothetical protein
LQRTAALSYARPAVRPRRGAASTSQGHPLAIFRRALQRGNLTVAEAVSKELPPLDLTDALELTILIARKDPRRHPRVAARWLLRYLEEVDDASRGPTIQIRDLDDSPGCKC